MLLLIYLLISLQLENNTVLDKTRSSTGNHELKYANTVENVINLTQLSGIGWGSLRISFGYFTALDSKACIIWADFSNLRHS